MCHVDVPLPRPSRAAPQCSKGCPCGNSCISCSKTCRR
jgi:hypothetical protein